MCRTYTRKHAASGYRLSHLGNGLLWQWSNDSIEVLATCGPATSNSCDAFSSSQAPGELGDFGQSWNPYPDNPVAFSKLQLKELKNGRLAMLAIMGEWFVL